MRRTRLAPWVALLGLVAACGWDKPAPGPTVEPRTPPRATPTARPVASLDPALIGAGSIGDRLYPSLGNLGYDVQAYEVHVTADPTAPEARIEATIAARATQPLQQLSLDYTGIPVSNLLVDGSPAVFEPRDGDLVITPARSIDRQDAFTISLEINGLPHGVQTVAGWQHTPTQIAAYGLYDATPSWLPWNGDPADKAVVDLWLDVPDAFTGVGPGTLVDSPSANGRRVWHWRTGDTSGITLLIGRLETLSLGSPDGIPVTSYVPPDLSDRWRTKLDVVPRILRLFEDRFGPYPYDTLTFAWAEHATAVADEGLVLWGADNAEPADLAHALAHQWFMTNVTPATSADSWLRNAFAQYGNLLWYEAEGGTESRDDVIRLWHQRLGERTEPPVSPSYLRGNQTIFGRGPLGLHALRVLVGDDAFFGILRAWVNEHHRGAATLTDFLDTAERVSGRSLDAWWRSWLVEPEVPDLSSLGLRP